MSSLSSDLVETKVVQEMAEDQRHSNWALRDGLALGYVTKTLFEQYPLSKIEGCHAA